MRASGQTTWTCSLVSVSGLVSITSQLSILPALSSLKDPLINPQSAVVPPDCQLLSVLQKWQVGPVFQNMLRLELPAWVRWSVVKDDSRADIVPLMLVKR